MDPVGKQSAVSQTSLAARGTGSESKGRVGALGIANGSLWRIRFTGTMLMFIFPLFVVTMAPKFPRCSLPRFSKKLNDLISHGFLKSQFECCYWFQVKVQTTTFYMLCVPWNQITEVKRTYFVMKNSWLTGFYQALGKIVSEKGNVGNLPSSLSYSSGLHQHLIFFSGFICLKNIFVALPNPLDKREVCASSLEKRRELWVFSVTSLTWPVSLFLKEYIKWIPRLLLMQNRKKEMWAPWQKNYCHSNHSLGSLLLFLGTLAGLLWQDWPIFLWPLASCWKPRKGTKLLRYIWRKPWGIQCLSADLFCLCLPLPVLILQGPGKCHRSFHEYSCGSHVPTNSQNHFWNIHPSIHFAVSQGETKPGLHFHTFS